MDKKTKNSPAFETVAARRIAPKICHGQPLTMCSECSRFHPNRFIFGGVIAERVNTAKSPRKENPIFGWNLSSSRITTSFCQRKWRSPLTRSKKKSEQFDERRSDQRLSLMLHSTHKQVFCRRVFPVGDLKMLAKRNRTRRSQHSQECQDPGRHRFCDSWPWPSTVWFQK